MTNKQSSLSFLRIVALIVVAVGAIGSLYYMFMTGRHQKSILLIFLFTAWVLSPYVALFLADKIAGRWSAFARAVLYWFMIVLTIGSLAAYGGAFNIPHTKPAAIFLIVPFISWLLIAIVAFIARKLSGT